MTLTHLPLSFCIEKECPIGTLEAVLATARRGGLQLVSLTMQQGDGRESVALELAATDRDLLDLFCRRLENIVDVSAISSSLTQ
jgi:acetolactate synthase regulatory subunit